MLTIPRLRSGLLALALGAGLVLTASPAHAQATRTWVSGVGDDVNPCSRTAPCKTFAGAISKTAAGGEIDVLDPGGFGAVTITKSITIDGSGGSIAGVITAGTNGIVIQAGANDNVVLRNLDLTDVTAAPSGCLLSGVKILSARSVQLEHLTISNYQNGVSLPMSNSSTDLYVDVTGHDLSIKNSSCAGFNASPDAGHLTRVSLSDSVLTQDNVAYVAGAGSESWISGSRLVLNNTGLQRGGGTAHDACGNTVAGNAVDGTFTDHAAACPAPSPASAATAYCVVPNLKGRSRASAAAALTSAHCTLGKVTKKKAKKAKHGKVVGQSIPAAVSVKQGTAVRITVGR